MECAFCGDRDYLEIYPLQTISREIRHLNDHGYRYMYCKEDETLGWFCPSCQKMDGVEETNPDFN